jgi:signal transduction histidine kinase
MKHRVCSTFFHLKASFVLNWQQVFGEARTRILLWYILLMSFFITLSLPLMRQFILAQVNVRVREDLIEDVNVFQGLLAKDPEIFQKFGLRAEEREKIQTPPTTSEELRSLFDLYVSRRIPEDDTVFLTFLNDQFYRSNILLPKVLQPDSGLSNYFITINQPTEGKYVVPNSNIGTIIYFVHPIYVNNQRLGTFVSAHLAEGEWREARQILVVVAEVMGFVFILALILAWSIAGRVLAPLRMLTNTARIISDSDLSQRIPVSGQGELAKLAMTFNEMMERLENAFATQRSFLNDAGHELRTPITIIQGHLELMGDDPKEQRETLALVMDELERMSRLVEDLILLAKAERPDFLYLETIDSALFTEEIFTKAKALADRNWQLEQVATGQFVGDRQRLTQVLINLSQNAAQHTGSSDTIGIGSIISQDQIQFWVRDTGEGIPSADQQRIFERFARSGNRSRRSEGAGLGLAICKAIVEAHGGQIHLQSQLDIGSKFTVVLPLAPSFEEFYAINQVYVSDSKKGSYVDYSTAT